MISIDDDLYFKDLNCDEVKIEDCCFTQFGLFICGNFNNVWSVLKYNGDDFIKCIGIMNSINNEQVMPHVKSIIDTTIGPLFITDEGDVIILEKDIVTRTNNDGEIQTEVVFQFTNLDSDKIYLPDINFDSKFGQKRNDVETVFGPQICAKGGVWKLSQDSYKHPLFKKTSFEDNDGNGPAPLQKLRVYINDENDNLPAIAKYLADKGLPLDVDIKCIGSIMYNGLQVLINGLQIISENGLSKNPQTVKFYIDKNARFTRNRQTIEALFGTDSTKWDSKDIGLISDYDPATGNYYNIPCQISKMNFMVLYE